METGASQKHTFPIRNKGDAPLTFEFVSHTCKCTTVELNGRKVEPGVGIVIPPGGESSVLLEWAAKVPPSPFRHGATFTTNDPANSRVEIRVEGEIVASTTLQPAELLFGSVRVGQPASIEMFVMSELEPEVKILDHEVVDQKLAERLKIAIEPAAKESLPKPSAVSGVKVTATLDPGGVIGPFTGSLKLKTSLGHAPNLEVPIYGAVKGDISIFGVKGWNEGSGLLRMDPVASAAGGSTRLTVALRGEHAADTQLSVARVDPPELKVSLGERVRVRDDFYQQPLQIEIPRGTKPLVRNGEDQGGDGEIVLSTTHPVTPEVRLRVNLTVKP
jgi:hypothetical protein